MAGFSYTRCPTSVHSPALRRTRDREFKREREGLTRIRHKAGTKSARRVVIESRTQTVGLRPGPDGNPPVGAFLFLGHQKRRRHETSDKEVRMLRGLVKLVRGIVAIGAGVLGALVGNGLAGEDLNCPSSPVDHLRRPQCRQLLANVFDCRSLRHRRSSQARKNIFHSREQMGRVGDAPALFKSSTAQERRRMTSRTFSERCWSWRPLFWIRCSTSLIRSHCRLSPNRAWPCVTDLRSSSPEVSGVTGNARSVPRITFAAVFSATPSPPSPATDSSQSEKKSQKALPHPEQVPWALSSSPRPLA